MKIFNLILLAGSALVPAAATAQTAAPPVRWEDTPDARLDVPGQPDRPAPGVTWRSPAPVRTEVRAGPPAQPRASMHPPMHAAAPSASAEGSYVVERRDHRGDRAGRHGPSMRHGRIDRGGSVHSYWWGPRFEIRDWNRYGFSQPFDGGRWIRYYDDALLIDRDGRVRDGRYDMDWDRHGERWDSDERGIPGYNYGDDDDDYAEDGDYRHEESRGDHRYDERVTHGGVSYGYPGYGYYGYAYGPTVTITETTVTEPVVTAHTVYRDAPRRKAKRHHKPRCHCPPPPPPRYDGERG